MTSFLFHYGANVYVFSYDREGVRKHTLIDAGDSRYRNQMVPILMENDINPANIERIIITHRHHDHCGLAALLSKEHRAKILVHSNFRSFVESEIRPNAQRWSGNFTPSQLKECDIEYLPQSGRSEVRSINGVDFPILAEHVEIGEAGELMILACPESTLTHSPDQIIVLYSLKGGLNIYENKSKDWRPTDDILFSGDLWLMRGPQFYWGVRNLPRRLRYGFYQIKNVVLGKSMPRRDPREQDSKAKEALKKGFQLIRVKPGHGEEFIGSRIIPDSLLSDRDLLVQLGYSMDANKSILRQKDLASKIVALKEQAYTNFVKGLLCWMELGYTLSERSALLVRIYKEQSGGGPLAEKDRKERRERLEATLTRVRNDKAESEELHQLAESALAGLRRGS